MFAPLYLFLNPKSILCAQKSEILNVSSKVLLMKHKDLSNICVMLSSHLFQRPIAGKRDNVSHWIRVSRRSCDAASRRRRPEVNSPYFAKRACVYAIINALCFGDAAILARFTALSQTFNLFSNMDQEL